jgi:molybdopterin converting factor small subunit
MPSIRIPTPLRTYTEGQSEVAVQGGSVAEALSDLVSQYPSIKPHLFNGSDALRPFVNLFLNEENVRELQGLETPLQPSDRLMLIPSIAGGRIESRE